MSLRTNTLIALPLLLLAPPATVAQGPGETAERRAVGLVEVLAGGDVEAAYAYAQENFAPAAFEERGAAEWKGLLTRLAGRLAGAEVGMVNVDEGGVMLGIATESGRMRLSFGFEPAPPHRLTELGVSLGGPGGDGGSPLPAPPLTPGMTHGEIAEALTTYFHELAAKDLFSGTALVAVGDKAIFTAAHGLASIEFGVANHLGTRFDVGSINKDFTKVSIGQLVERGKLSLADTIADHLPDYPNPEVAAKVTVAQLVEHSAGLGDIFSEEFFRSSKALYRTPQDYFPLFANQPLLFEPGTSQRYSNGGYMVLGAIIEAASGMPYADYVEKHVFDPAGMTATGFFARDEPVPDVAIGYTKRGPDGGEGKLRNNLFMLSIQGSPAGSAFSTVGDLHRFIEALRTYRLLPPAWSRWVFGGPAPAPGAGGDGATTPKLSGLGVGLAGGGPGVSAVMVIEDDLEIFLLSNRDEPSTEQIVRRLREPLVAALGGG